MKLSWIASAAIACAAGVTPVALAESTETASSAEAAFELSTGVPPVTVADVRYPYEEHRSSSEGECTVVFDVSSAGEPTNLRTEACSSRNFRREARRVASSLRYPADALPSGGLQDQTFTLRWVGDEG